MICRGCAKAADAGEAKHVCDDMAKGWLTVGSEQKELSMERLGYRGCTCAHKASRSMTVGEHIMAIQPLI